MVLLTEHTNCARSNKPITRLMDVYSSIFSCEMIEDPKYSNVRLSNLFGRDTNKQRKRKLTNQLIFTLFWGGVCFHVFVEGRSVDKGFLALSALELLNTRVGRNVSRQVRVYRKCFS